MKRNNNFMNKMKVTKVKFIAKKIIQNNKISKKINREKQFKCIQKV